MADPRNDRWPAQPSQVARWLAAHPEVDPAVLARRSKQRAGEKAAAIDALAAIGTRAALDAIATYRPQGASEGPGGETFSADVAQALARAWSRFDRGVFAARMFAGLPLLLENAGALRDLRGLEALPELTALRVLVDPACDLAPLASCGGLTHLELFVNGRSGGLEPVGALARLTRLGLYNGEALDPAALAPLAGCSALERFYLTTRDVCDLQPLLGLRSLRSVQLGAGPFRADASVLDGLRALLERGVTLVLFKSEGWWSHLAETMPGLSVGTRTRRAILAMEPAGVEELELRMGLSSASFFD